MKVLITQSNYIPWKGFFDSIAMVDTYVVYDDMQYTRQDWRNRNIIKTEQGLKWLTIAVEMKGRLNKKIREIKIADKNWNKSHISTIKQSYKNAVHYKEMIDWIEPLYRNCDFEFLTDINSHFIKNINHFLNINTHIVYSSDFNLLDDRNERLVNICKELGADKYLSGPKAKDYIDEELFLKNKLKIEYIDYSNYPVYSQLHGEFEHGVSVLDLIFNQGTKAINFLKYSNSNCVK